MKLPACNSICGSADNHGRLALLKTRVKSQQQKPKFTFLPRFTPMSKQKESACKAGPCCPTQPGKWWILAQNKKSPHAGISAGASACRGQGADEHALSPAKPHRYVAMQQANEGRDNSPLNNND